MIIVTTYDLLSREIGQHFGEAKHFMVYDSTTDSCKIVDNGGYSHHALVGYIKGLGADVFICGGIGAPAVGFLNEVGVEVIPGICGNALEAAKAYMNKSLVADPSKIHACGDHHH